MVSVLAEFLQLKEVATGPGDLQIIDSWESSHRILMYLGYNTTMRKNIKILLGKLQFQYFSVLFLGRLP